MQTYAAKLGTRGVIVVGLTLVIAVLIAWVQLKGKWHAWRADRYKQQTIEYAEQAKQAAAQAKTAETSSVIARDASERMANITPIIVYPAEQSAQRIEAKAYEQEAAGRVEPAVDDDILRELAEGRDAYTSAAGGVQRKGSR